MVELHLIIISTTDNLAPFFILVSPKLLVVRMFVCFTCQSNQTQYKPIQRNLRGISENLKKPKEHLKLDSLCP